MFCCLAVVYTRSLPSHQWLLFDLWWWTLIQCCANLHVIHYGCSSCIYVLSSWRPIHLLNKIYQAQDSFAFCNLNFLTGVDSTMVNLGLFTFNQFCFILQLHFCICTAFTGTHQTMLDTATQVFHDFSSCFITITSKILVWAHDTYHDSIFCYNCS